MSKRAFALVAASLAVLSAASPTLASGGAEPSGGYNIFAGDIAVAFWTIVVFGAVVFVLGKFAWPKILSGLQEREAFIRDSLAQAKADREAAEARLKSYEERLAQARAEATAIVEEARRDAEAVKGRILAEAQKESEKLTERAKREIGIAKETAVKDLYVLAGRLATDAASRIIRQELRPDDHQRLIAEAIEQIERGAANPSLSN